jgi:PAS domain S-box-containing protein
MSGPDPAFGVCFDSVPPIFRLRTRKGAEMKGQSKAEELRRAAEASVQGAPNGGQGTFDSENLRLRHELQVHQIELETQNEALRMAQIVLEASRDRYVDLYDFAPVGYLTLSATGQIVEANLTAATYLGIDRKQLIKHRFDAFVAAPDRDRWQHQFIFAMKRVERLRLDLQLSRGDGSIALYDVNCLRVGAGHTESSLRIALIDITERKQAELALGQAKVAADAANRAKNIFLATMSHELRTPLNAIMGMTELALRRVTDPKQGEQLNKVKTGAISLLDIIKDILDISRIEADRLHLHDDVFSLDHVLDTVSNTFGAKAANKNFVVIIDIDPKLALQPIRGDRLRLGQVLLNLIGNAIKFTSQGSVTLRVLIDEEHPDSLALRFEVTDTGIGIAAEDKQRIFNAFEQADGSTTRKFGGSGLGLTICKRLVQLMGGEIHLDSQVGVGSSFWFVLRFDKVAVLQPPVSLLEALALCRQLKERHAGATVLVAEDDPVNQVLVQELLVEAGLNVHLAENGAVAVELARRTSYDLILMDVQMPIMDGLEATRQIRKLSHNPAAPIIALTANVFPEDENQCRAAGMNDFIGRPVESEVLYKTLLKWLERQGTSR